jgi:hypothetical protein
LYVCKNNFWRKPGFPWQPWIHAIAKNITTTNASFLSIACTPLSYMW